MFLDGLDLVILDAIGISNFWSFASFFNQSSQNIFLVKDTDNTLKDGSRWLNQEEKGHVDNNVSNWCEPRGNGTDTERMKEGAYCECCCQVDEIGQERLFGDVEVENGA